MPPPQPSTLLNTKAASLDQALQLADEAAALAILWRSEAQRVSTFEDSCDSLGDTGDAKTPEVRRIPNCGVKLFDGIVYKGTFIGTVGETRRYKSI